MDDMFFPKYGYLPGPPPGTLPRPPKMPWTIEQQLRSYAMSPQSTERHQILWTSWQQNRRWFSQLLEYTVFSAPMYSRHNAAHCEAVIHNIECLLGEEEIRRLSASDCFALLTAVYLHDIGMVGISADRQGAVKSGDFHRFVENLQKSPDSSMRWAADVFIKWASLAKNQSPEYQPQYDIYRSMVLLLAEYQRRQHADVSAQRLNEWIKDPSKLQSGLLMTGIPMRIFLQIAGCARAHGESDFQTLLDTLPQYDGGFAQDTYHPMFIAVLLSLGDILDLDNNRFNPFAQDVAGEDDLFPAASQVHYLKHQAIRSLRISPKRIHIEADCGSPNELRLLCQELDWLGGFLKNCSYHWASIAPDNFRGCLPVVELDKVSLNGAKIPTNLVTTKFELSQKKAFYLLSGANLYDLKYPFLRELLQNAIDAVKLQYFTDYSASEFGEMETLGLSQANQTMPFKKYPIHVDMAVKKRRLNSDGQLSDIVKADFDLPLDQLLREYEFGVEIKVQDCGIGISAEDIQHISKVGSSHEHRLEQLSHMPEWLRPTGHFGIGLQSLFLVDDRFTCVTRTRTAECYEMTFHSGDRAEGYINIIPRPVQSAGQGDIPYGTCFSVFVPERHKVSHNDDMTGWLGMDPYQEDYDKYRKLRRSIELMVQMEESFDALIGERLFPIITREQTLDPSLDSFVALREKLRARAKSRGRESTWQPISPNIRRLDRDEAKETCCWLFETPEKALPAYQFGHLPDGSAYSFDAKHGSLCGWSQHAGCFFRCNARRILQSGGGGGAQRRQGVRLFIKGLFVTEIACVENDLFDFIDIQNDQLQEHLQMSRDGLTAQGVQKLTREIIPQIQRTFDLILRRINEANLALMAENRAVCLEAFPLVCKQVLSHSRNGEPFRGMDAFIKKFKKHLESFPETAFSYFSLLPLKDKDGKIISSAPNHPAWSGFWRDAFSALVPDYRESRAPYSPNRKPNTRVGPIGTLRRAFENHIEPQLKKDLTDKLLKSLAHKLQKALKEAGAKEVPLVKASLDRFRSQLTDVHQVMFLCALCFFYANSCRSSAKDSCAKEQVPCSWEHLNQGISTLVHDLDCTNNTLASEFSRLWDETLLLPCIVEAQPDTIRRGVTISDVMLRGRRYAVFASRSSHQGHWKHMLVRLSPFPEAEDILHIPGATAADLLSWRPAKAGQCQQRERLLEQWHEQIIAKIYNSHFRLTGDKPASPDSSLWESPIARWMLAKLPSLSAGSDESGNNRINVLAFQAPSQLFMNTCMINLLTERMKNTYETHNAQRMRTTTWDGLAALNCKDDITTNILRADRGKTSAANREHSMLMAFPSQLPQNICLPNGETLNMLEIYTTYDLLKLFRSIYTQENDQQENLYGFTYAQDVFEFASDIVKLLTLNLDDFRTPPEISSTTAGEQDLLSAAKQQEPSPTVGESGPAKPPSPAALGPSDSRPGLLDILQRKFREQQRQKLESLDPFTPNEEQEYIRSEVHLNEEFFLAESPEQLCKNLVHSYHSKLLDLFEGQLKSERTRTVWSKVDLPDDPERYMNSLLVFLYGFDLDDPAIRSNLSTFSLYQTTDQLLNELEKVYWAVLYLFQYSEQQYQEEFLDNICRWWADEVWAKDPGQPAFVAYNEKHLIAPLERQELLELYQEQLRMLVRAQIAPLKSPIANVLDGLNAFQPA